MVKLTIAWQSLIHGKTRAVITIAGISFSIALIFIQLGLYDAIFRMALLVSDRLNFDVVLVSPDYAFLGRTGTFSRRRISQARAVPGVESAVPLYLGLKPWRNPQSRLSHQIFILAFDPHDRVFLDPEIEGQMQKLKEPDTLLIDRQTRPEFGSLEPGVTTEMGQHKVKVVGQFTLGTGFLAYGAMVTSDQTYSRLLDGYPLQDVQFGLVKLHPGANLNETVAALRAALPADVLVLTREQLNALEEKYWAVKSSVGLICGFGAVVAIIVGIVILYQVLATDVVNSLPQYATLKAMGYTDRSVAQIVLLKACLLGSLAYAPAVLLALIAYAITQQLAKLLTVMTWERLVGVLALTLLMCTVTGVVCMRKLRSADPADLF